MGRITTHVLDTGRGKPAAGMRIELHRASANGILELAAECMTNEDGRTSVPLLQGEGVQQGVYELRFEAGAYLKQTYDSGISDETLWDTIPIRFRVTETQQHYHIPLLIAPGGYSTYRGS
ncbi:hydroxyisourate hydrolase [Paenibacillus sp. P96]|uniref:5-hydroxyisourate hydrolase n=1 Tax=Paenibacillus zeirhizosphaerae TaxID=2987519 RepID=A0ABT9FVF2_9BACL|nr:hydroxyisourate hydrolase [Paenibacillus sp. P96]MDP4098718.1 hydroxyisourate hydrolase [Paenibacillus sp. P96]